MPKEAGNCPVMKAEEVLNKGMIKLMMLLPKPKEIKAAEGIFKLSHKTAIVLDSRCSFSDFESARLLQKEIKACAGVYARIGKAFKTGDGDCIYLRLDPGKYDFEAYDLEIAPQHIRITAGDAAGLFYGIQTLRQIVRLNGSQLPCVIIGDNPHFKYRGYFYDITRGKMPTLDSLKELVDRLSFYKINQLQLYMEYTFAFKKHSEVWIMKSKRKISAYFPNLDTGNTFAPVFRASAGLLTSWT